ncbi:DUF4864 domain-containing protein [Pontibacter vulgaris]|uniref:DUF4864 domain-containing protein n=1 Tax=Pontibacter vulgaris TaxID=2905679 RepID=UPI001FA7755A|nr:DUF4864 domain-containing protein [Pontibacter vulgaris]
MRRLEQMYDKLLLGVGVILLAVLWVHIPAAPSRDVHHYAVYTSPSAETASTSKWTYLRPDKTLSPREVIHIQLKALQQNDKSDSGIITVFNFSSPANRVRLGPLNHFRMMVRDPAYSTILNFKSYKPGKMVIADNSAYQMVVIKGQDGQQAAYLFILTKQKRGPYKDCWMTEGVACMQPEPQSYYL